MYLIRTSQQVDESDAGYRVRLLEVNGYTKTWRVLRKDKELRDEIDASMMTHTPSSGDVRRRIVTARRYCPLCLDEREVWRRDWDVKAVTACAVHKVFLESSCAQCGTILTWQKARLTRCAVCDALLANRIARPATEIISSVARLIGGYPVPGFEAFSVEDLQWLAVAFVFFGTNPTSSRWRKEQIGLWDEGQCVEYGTRAHSVLVDWPVNFFSWLDERSLTKPHSKQLSAFGPWLYRLRYALGDSVNYGPLLVNTLKAFGPACL